MNAVAEAVAALPPALRAQWDGILESGERIEALLGSESPAGLEALGAERQARIEAFFAAYPAAPGSARARLALLRELIGANAALLERSRAQLDDSARAVAGARHRRRAIGAYRGEAGLTGS